MSDEEFMRLALEEAASAAEHGDVPVGRGHNRRELDADPTAHAEVVALRDAARRIGHWRIEATLFVTLEPCVMCAGALVNARVRRVVFGALDPKAGALQSLFQVGQDPRLNHRYDVEGGVLASEAVEALQSFFRRLRSEGQK
jgi:tRNA(adenine34) deaminase